MATKERTTRETVRSAVADRIPPQAIDAEVAVIGAMLLDTSAVGAVSEILDDTAFYKGAHRKIFRAVIDLFSKEDAVDLVTVTQELKRKKELDDVGGAAYLSTGPRQRRDDRERAASREDRSREGRPPQTHQRRYRGRAGGLRRRRRRGRHPRPRRAHDLRDRAGARPSRLRADARDPQAQLRGHPGALRQEAARHGHRVRVRRSRLDDVRVSRSPIWSSSPGGPRWARRRSRSTSPRTRRSGGNTPTAIFSLEMGKEQLVQRMLCSEAQRRRAQAQDRLPGRQALVEPDDGGRAALRGGHLHRRHAGDERARDALEGPASQGRGRTSACSSSTICS